MSGLRCFLLGEFVGGPRDGDVLVIHGPAFANREIVVPLPSPPFATASTPPDLANPSRPRVGRYTLGRSYREARIAPEMLAHSKVPLLELVAFAVDGFRSEYVWQGE